MAGEICIGGYSVKIELRKLKEYENNIVYEMFQEIPKEECGVTNNCNGRTKEQFFDWIIRSIAKEKVKD